MLDPTLTYANVRLTFVVPGDQQLTETLPRAIPTVQCVLHNPADGAANLESAK
jgi:hypothetical protein